MIIFVLFFIIAGVLLIDYWIHKTTSHRILELNELPIVRYGLVLGAGLEKNGKPTDILSDRVLSAIDLLNAGKVDKLLMTGSSNEQSYDEVNAMQNLAIEKGVQPTKLELDRQGNSTLDSIINYKNKFKNFDSIIITQRFHLFRALWLAGLLGLTSFGFAANHYHFSSSRMFYWSTRELAASPINLLKLFYRYLRKRI
jgi:SanA protein